MHVRAAERRHHLYACFWVNATTQKGHSHSKRIERAVDALLPSNMLSNENSVSIIRALKYQVDQEKKKNEQLSRHLYTNDVLLEHLKAIHHGQKFGDDEVPTNLNDWTTAHVAKYLIKNGWGSKIRLFEIKRIDGKVLMSGYISKNDLMELGFSGIDASRFLTWIQECRRSGGDIHLVGRELTPDELILAVKYAFRISDSNDDYVLSKKECLLACQNNPEVSEIFSSCESLKGLCTPRLCSETFDRIDTDSSGYISVRELLIAADLIDKQNVGFAYTMEDILVSMSGSNNGNCEASKTISRGKLQRAIVLNQHGIYTAINHHGYGANLLMFPSQYHNAFDEIVTKSNDSDDNTASSNDPTFRQIITYIMREDKKYVNRMKNKNNIMQQNEKQNLFDPLSVTSELVQQTVDNAENDTQQQMLQLQARAKTHHKRLIAKLRRRKSVHLQQKASKDGFKDLSTKVDSMTEQIHALEGLVRIMYNNTVNTSERPGTSAEAKIMRVLATTIKKLEAERQEQAILLHEKEEIIANYEADRRLSKKHLDDIREQSYRDMYVFLYFRFVCT
jgi:hypothetical protein